MVHVAPYIVPLFLGMTFDARNTKPGVDIYDLKFVDAPTEVKYGTASSLYKITKDMSDVQDLLDVSGALSLKIKTGMIDIKGKGSYLKNDLDFKNKVEILTYMKYTSKVKSLPPDAKPFDNWATLYNPNVLGTHYVKSITYGAEMIASARFVTEDASNIEDIKGEVEAALGAGGKGNELTVKGTLEKLEEKLKGKANLEISYYGTLPLKSIPNTIEGLRTLVSTFKEQVEESDMSEGVPMSVGLSPLVDLPSSDDKSQFAFIMNQDLLDQLSEFEEQMDELKQARLDLVKWAKAQPWNLKREYEQEIGVLLKNITKITELFYDVVWEMDLTQGADQLQPALEAYDYDDEGIYNRFSKNVRKLVAKLDPLIKRDEVASDTYIQWGNNNCTAGLTTILYEGFAFSSIEQGPGGNSKYGCALRNTQKGYELETTKKSHLAGIRYTDFDKASNPFQGAHAKKIAGKGLPCAKCHSPDSASIAMFPATVRCPLTWEVMYRGYLMSARSREGFTTEYICVDESPSEPYEMAPHSTAKDTVALTTVHSRGALPADVFKEGTLVRCILCSMKSNQVSL